MKVGVIVGTWESLPHTKFCNNCLRGYTPFGQVYTKKLQILEFLGAVSPPCQTVKFGVKKIAQGDIPLGSKYIPKIIFVILRAVRPSAMPNFVKIA